MDRSLAEATHHRATTPAITWRFPSWLRLNSWFDVLFSANKPQF